MSLINWVRGLSVAGRVVLGLSTVGVTGTILQSVYQTQQTSAPSVSAVKSISTTNQITKKTVTETESIPYSSIEEQDPTLTKGIHKVKTIGVNGEKSLVYDVTFENGKQTDKKLVISTVTKTPVQEVVLVGTYEAPAATTICDNGTYVNSSGNIVCRPEAATTVPAGASARCADGTYSFSQTRRGTCSHHGGVSIWY